MMKDLIRQIVLISLLAGVCFQVLGDVKHDEPAKMPVNSGERELASTGEQGRRVDPNALRGMFEALTPTKRTGEQTIFRSFNDSPIKR